MNQHNTPSGQSDQPGNGYAYTFVVPICEDDPQLNEEIMIEFALHSGGLGVTVSEPVQLNIFDALGRVVGHQPVVFVEFVSPRHSPGLRQMGQILGKIMALLNIEEILAFKSEQCPAERDDLFQLSFLPPDPPSENYHSSD
ncbi:MAG: hypothetical protein OES12_09535 [Anaerolineae bacterium]|nr:hypothetical protein [Anaerolineae bacterium]